MLEPQRRARRWNCSRGIRIRANTIGITDSELYIVRTRHNYDGLWATMSHLQYWSYSVHVPRNYYCASKLHSDSIFQTMQVLIIRDMECIRMEMLSPLCQCLPASVISDFWYTILILTDTNWYDANTTSSRNYKSEFRLDYCNFTKLTSDSGSRAIFWRICNPRLEWITPIRMGLVFGAPNRMASPIAGFIT